MTECCVSLLCWYWASDLILHCHILDSSGSHMSWGFRCPGMCCCIIAWVAPGVTNNHVPLSYVQNQSIKRNQCWVFFMDLLAFMMKTTQSFNHWEPNLTHRHIAMSHKTWILSKTAKRTSNLALIQPTTKLVLWASWSMENSRIIMLTTQVSLALKSTQLCFAPVPNSAVTVRYINTISSLFCLFQLVKCSTLERSTTSTCCPLVVPIWAVSAARI